MEPSKLKSARAVADVSSGTLLASVEIAAPPDRVFRALASDDITKWWGSPETYRTTKWSGEVRVGGTWIAEGVGNDGTPFSVRGEYLEVDPPRKIVQTWIAAWIGNLPTTVTYRLDPIEGGTRVTVRHEGFGDRVDACQSHTDGWERVLGWVSAWLGSER